MSTIKVEQGHDLSIEDARARVEAFGQDMKERFGLSIPGTGIERAWRASAPRETSRCEATPS